MTEDSIMPLNIAKDTSIKQKIARPGAAPD